MNAGLTLYDNEGAETDYIPFDASFDAHPEEVLRKLQMHHVDALDYRAVAAQYLNRGNPQAFLHILQAGLRTFLV